MASALAALALLLNAFTWGVAWWPFRQLQALQVHPLWATALVYSFALLALLLFKPRAWRAFAAQPLLWGLLIAAGLANVGFNWAVTVGDVVRVVLLFYLMPAWVVLLAWPLLGERPTGASLLRLLIALTGVVVVLKAPGVDWPWPQSLADWLALMAGFTFALTNILLRRLRGAPQAACMLAMFGGATVMAGCAAFAGLGLGVVNALPTPQWNWWLWIGGLGTAFLIGNLGLQYGAARLSASATSIIMLSEVVFASASAVLLGAGTLEPRTLVGGALILLASLLSVWPKGRPPLPAHT
jgi:drug/metabolite transporter (DMT)-like permease